MAWRDAAIAALELDTGARWSAVGGTGWAQAWRVDAGGTRLFVKATSGRHADAIDAEADGLRALKATRTVRVPGVIGSGESAGTTYLVLEWLDLGTQDDGAALARALVALHRAIAPRGPAGQRFGWHRDNWIGGTPQVNAWCDDWCGFFRDMRLAPQIALAVRNDRDKDLRRDGERLLDALPALLCGHDPAPSLLHGDLWSGNVAALQDGTPVMFDPAVYVGDREADLAMTELFGGFGRDFHAAYRDAWPLDDGYPLRRTLYNLYHVLNHWNLFGRGYLGQARRMMAALLAAIL